VGDVEAGGGFDTKMVFESYGVYIIFGALISNLAVAIVDVGVGGEHGFGGPADRRGTQSLELWLIEVEVEQFEVLVVETLMEGRFTIRNTQVADCGRRHCCLMFAGFNAAIRWGEQLPAGRKRQLQLSTWKERTYLIVPGDC
jgi:hypothetical protein